MRCGVLGAVRWDRPNRFFEIDLRPAHSGDLATTLSRESQQLHELRKRKALDLCRVPARDKLVILKDAVASYLLGRRLQTSDRTVLDRPSINAPGE